MAACEDHGFPKNAFFHGAVARHDKHNACPLYELTIHRNTRRHRKVVAKDAREALQKS